MSQSATPATRNEATTRLKPPKMTTSAELPIGTAIRSSYGRLRTVANGCERLRTVANGSATSSEHTLNPQTPRVKREPLLRIREKCVGDDGVHNPMQIPLKVCFGPVLMEFRGHFPTDYRCSQNIARVEKTMHAAAVYTTIKRERFGWHGQTLQVASNPDETSVSHRGGIGSWALLRWLLFYFFPRRQNRGIPREQIIWFCMFHHFFEHI